ncbi:MAG: hypothetical protein C5B55_14905 [Blastocatellia bacterium]|nr:MAG: hypothetical protein C5B55_14905 [Blastocatellia bacterium]
MPGKAHVLLAALLFAGTLFLHSSLSAQNVDGGPEITGFYPQAVSANSILQLQGYRLGATDSSGKNARFIQNGMEVSARTGGGSSTSNDNQRGEQTLEIIVPELLVVGPAQVVLEVNGRRTPPITVNVVDWKLPELKSIAPITGLPGTVVEIECVGFHINDEIVLTDSNGKTKRWESGGSVDRTSFTVPKDAPDGVMIVQIGSRKHGNLLTPPLSFFVATGPLPLDVAGAYMKSVAPGQWLRLSALSYEPLKRSELTEVAFKQKGRTIIVSAPDPHCPRIPVPNALSPGEVQLQVRTWRNEHPSAWSEAVVVRLSETPVPSMIEGIRLEPGSWVDLWPGPERAKSFSAAAGDVIVMNGAFPVADVTKLKVTLNGSIEAIDLKVTDVTEKGQWLNQISVKLPASVEREDWKITVSNVDDGASVELPIIIRIR